MGAKGAQLETRQQVFLDKLEREIPERMKKQARLELQETINTLQLQKWENVRDALKFPKTLQKMNTRQLIELNEILSGYKTGDEFLPVRMMETLSNTKLTGVRTTREVLDILAKEKGLTIEMVENLKPTEFHRFMGDHMLARQHPFFETLGTNGQKKQFKSLVSR